MPRKKYKNIASSAGESSKVVVVEDKYGNVRKLKEKGSKGKSKTKYNLDGTIKKSVRKKGLKRSVDKFKRDSRKTMLNTFRNQRFDKGGIIQHD